MPSKASIEAKRTHRSDILKLILSSEAYSADAVKAIGRRLADGISDVEWRRVQQYASLPDEARNEINRLISHYWNWRVDEWIPERIQQTVKQIRADTLRLKDKLAALSNDDDFYKGIFLEYKMSPAQYEYELRQASDHLSRLDTVLFDAEHRLVDGVSRASYKVTFTCMRALDAVCSSFNREMTTSKKALCGSNFVLEVFGLVDVQIAPGSVTHLLKDYVYQRDAWGGSEEMMKQFRS